MVGGLTGRLEGVSALSSVLISRAQIPHRGPNAAALWLTRYTYFIPGCLWLMMSHSVVAVSAAAAAASSG